MLFTSFTTQERMVLLFLSVTLLIGGIVKWTQIQNTPALQIKTSSVYTEMATYKAVSHKLNAVQTSTEKEKAPAATVTPEGKIHINQASATTLEQIPGIGPTLAERIIAYRTEHGPFTQVEDITRVKGIGTKMFEKISKSISTD